MTQPTDTRIRAITLHQPWASALVFGYKPDETRSWRCNLPPGSLVAIHAGKSTQWIAYDIHQEPHFREVWRRHQIIDLPLGCIIGISRFIACYTTDAIYPSRTPAQRALGDYRPGRYAWHLEPVLNLHHRPIYTPGKQGLWWWTPDARTMAAIQTQIEWETIVDDALTDVLDELTGDR